MDWLCTARSPPLKPGGRLAAFAGEKAESQGGVAKPFLPAISRKSIFRDAKLQTIRAT